jgi:Ca2+-binding RTX toxin-like protein
MNGQVCTTLGDGAGTALSVATGATSSTVKKIIISSSGLVMLDLFTGTLPSVFAGAAGTGIEVTFTGGAGSFLVRGSSTADTVKVVKGSTGENYLDLNQLAVAPDGKADVKLTGAASVKFSLGDGNDVFTPLAVGPMSYNAVVLTGLVMPTVSMTVYGGAGNDVLTDSNGADSFFGGDGDDIIKATNAGSDTLSGGGSAGDTLDYSARSVAINATLGGDVLIGAVTSKNSGFGILYGGYGNDTLTGDDGANVIYGGNNGHDLIDGKAGADSIWGGVGNDTIYGGDGNTIDYLFGEAGDDKFVAAADEDGVDVINGGGNTNELNYGARAAGVTLTLGSAGTEENATNIQWLVGGAGDDTLTGSAGNDKIEGGAGNDAIDGGDGDDILGGGDDADTLTGGLGADVLDGNAGNDSLIGGAGDDALTGGAGDDALAGDAGNDQLLGGDGDDVLAGGDGADLLAGGIGTNTMDGGADAGDICISDPAATDSTPPTGCDVF